MKFSLEKELSLQNMNFSLSIRIFFIRFPVSFTSENNLKKLSHYNCNNYSQIKDWVLPKSGKLKKQLCAACENESKTLRNLLDLESRSVVGDL